MRSVRAALFRVMNLLGRRGHETDLMSELDLHLELQIEEYVRQGLSLSEARRRAFIKAGGIEATKDRYRDQRRGHLFEALVRDVRYGLRQLRAHQALTVTAVLTLTICIGLTAAVYSVVHAVIVRSLPYPHSERLAQLANVYEASGNSELSGYDGVAWDALNGGTPNLQWAADSGGGSSGVNLVVNGRATYLRQHAVSGRFFQVLGIAPILGPGLTADDDRLNGPAVVVLSFGTWQRIFQANPSVIGTRILLRGEPYTVVGVMPRTFEDGFDADEDIWIPLRPSPQGTGSGSNYRLIARLRDGTSWAQAETEVAAMSPMALRHAQEQFPRARHLTLWPLQRGLSDAVRLPVLALGAAVGLVLLIACLNIAGLLIAQGAMRRRELATRLALGGSRARLVQQLLVESLLLTMGGGIGGLVLAVTTTSTVARLAETWLPPYAHVTLDRQVLGVMLLVMAGTTVISGVLPAWQATRVDVRSALVKSGTHTIVGGTHQRLRRLLVCSEIALSALLLVAASVLTRSLLSLTQQPPGFNPSRLVSASVSLQDARYQETTRIVQLFGTTLTRIRMLPGVESAAVSLTLPYQRGMNIGFRRLEGPAASAPYELTTLTYVTPSYFETLETPVRTGRIFAEADQPGGLNVAVVNETFARRYLNRQEPLGAHLDIVGGVREVIGIVGDTPQIGEAFGSAPVALIPEVFLPAAQVPDELMRLAHGWWSPAWVIRARGDQGALIAPMQAALADADPGLTVAAFQNISELRDRSVTQPRVLSVLISVFAVIALGLAAIGTYGLMAALVVERTRELGVRLALGASVRQAMQSAALPGLTLAVGGIGVGSVLAWASRGWLQHVVWNVSPADPASFVVAASVLLIVAGLATVLPTWRILRLDPAQTLRSE